MPARSVTFPSPRTATPMRWPWNCGLVKPVLVDPGTYTYGRSRAWRCYFRSTLAHNTVELGGFSQSAEGGPFLWTSKAHGTLLSASGLDEDFGLAVVVGEHDGYMRQGFKGRHRRRVTLDRHKRSLQ